MVFRRRDCGSFKTLYGVHGAVVVENTVSTLGVAAMGSVSSGFVLAVLVLLLLLLLLLLRGKNEDSPKVFFLFVLPALRLFLPFVLGRGGDKLRDGRRCRR